MKHTVSLVEAARKLLQRVITIATKHTYWLTYEPFFWLLCSYWEPAGETYVCGELMSHLAKLQTQSGLQSYLSMRSKALCATALPVPSLCESPC